MAAPGCPKTEAEGAPDIDADRAVSEVYDSPLERLGNARLA